MPWCAVNSSGAHGITRSLPHAITYAQRLEQGLHGRLQAQAARVSCSHQSMEVTMAGAEASSEPASQEQTALGADMDLEVVTLPVADIDRAKHFYQSLGWRLDA